MICKGMARLAAPYPGSGEAGAKVLKTQGPEPTNGQYPAMIIINKLN